MNIPEKYLFLHKRMCYNVDMFDLTKRFSGNMYVSGHGIVRCSAYVENGRILSLGSYEDDNALPEGWIVLPGFIDKHVHGAGGADCMRGEDALNVMSEKLAFEGVTRFLPTTMTAPKEDIFAALKSMGEQIKKGDFAGAKPIGIHLEGPFIATEKAGAQPPEDILSFSEPLFTEMVEASKGTIMQVTYAPERNAGMTAFLKGSGIVASVGHTTATAEEVLLAEQEGATSLTHVYNAMTGLSHRNCGTVGGAMLAEDMICELICDGKHVEKEAVRVLYKTAKGRICLITDATEAKYLPDGEYHLGKNEIVVKDDLARLKDGTIAGSVLKMNVAVKNFRDFCGATIEEAVDAATIVPARCLKIDKDCGSIGIGKYADFVFCDRDFNVIHTVGEGNILC